MGRYEESLDLGTSVSSGLTHAPLQGRNTGLITLVYEYVDTLDVNDRQRSRLFEYLDFIRKRSTGELQTPATWIRNFVRSHPAYKFDSVVSEEINYDLLKEVDEMWVVLMMRRSNCFSDARFG